MVNELLHALAVDNFLMAVRVSRAQGSFERYKANMLELGIICAQKVCPRKRYSALKAGALFCGTCSIHLQIIENFLCDCTEPFTMLSQPTKSGNPQTFI